MANLCTMISVLAAAFAACFAGAAWITAHNALKYTKAKEAPHLLIARDVFIYGTYEITPLTNWGTPHEVPAETVVLKRFQVKELGHDIADNKPCLIFNSSSHDSSSAEIANYSGLFGEVYLENRGETKVIQIEIIECFFKMRPNKHNWKDFSLKGEGKLNIDLSQDSPFIFYVGYLCDNDSHMICNPNYMIDGKLCEDAIKVKKLKTDQLNCYLPIIIDLYEELDLVIKYTSIDGTQYIQRHTIKVLLEDEGGRYISEASRARVVRLRVFQQRIAEFSNQFVARIRK